MLIKNYDTKLTKVIPKKTKIKLGRGEKLFLNNVDRSGVGHYPRASRNAAPLPPRPFNPSSHEPVFNFYLCYFY